MERNVTSNVEGFIGASDDKCYRMDLTVADEEWLQGLCTGQRVIMLIDFFMHMLDGGVFSPLPGMSIEQTRQVMFRMEDYLLAPKD